MLVKGYVTNNTGRSRHIFKRTVYPGQKVPLHEVHSVVGRQVPEGVDFIDWLEQYLPSGWELDVVSVEEAKLTGGRTFKEVLTAVPTVAEPSTEGAIEVSVAEETVVGVSHSAPQDEEDEEDDGPSLEYATPRAIEKMTARDVYNLRLKDNPKRILKNITSIYKLRRALTLCKGDSRKATLTRLIQGRIRELNVTL